MGYIQQGQKMVNKSTGEVIEATGVQDIGGGQMGQYFSSDYDLHTEPATPDQPDQPIAPTQDQPVVPVDQPQQDAPVEEPKPKPKPTSADPDIQSIVDKATAQNAEGISELVVSGNEFTEQDAQNFAYFNKDKNWQQYVGGIGGRPNPLYIGSTNWTELQKTYTPYQLEKAVTRNQSGIYWNPDVNIGDIPRIDPAERLNEETGIISDLVSDAKSEADITISDKAKIKEKKEAPTLSADLEENKKEVMDLLNNMYGGTAESIYNELYDTTEMKTANTKVIEARRELDEYDEQLEALKGDIRKEVEGEASESYINAKAAIRGEEILKLRRVSERDYDDAISELNFLKSEASNLLQVRVKDSDNRYNRLFSMLQLQIQEEGTQFNQDVALAQIGMQLPAGRTMKIGGNTVKGLNENANLNVVQFTEANGNTYVIGFDKATGEEKYKKFIGKAQVGGAKTEISIYEQLREYQSGRALEQYKKLDEAMAKPVSEQGSVRTATDEDGKLFYYDAYALEQAKKGASWWWDDKLDPIEHLINYK